MDFCVAGVDVAFKACDETIASYFLTSNCVVMMFEFEQESSALFQVIGIFIVHTRPCLVRILNDSKVTCKRYARDLTLSKALQGRKYWQVVEHDH